MTEEEVQDLIYSWENLSLIVSYMCEHPTDLELLVKLALDDSKTTNYRSIWMVEKVHDRQPGLIVPYLPLMIEFLEQTKNSGKKRHLLKLVSLYPIAEDNLAFLLDFCIGIFTNPNEEIAVRVHAMQILYNIAETEPVFANELIDLIENEMEYHGSAGISSRGKKLLKKLYRIKNSQN